MKIITYYSRAFSTTRKQITRGGWLSLASITIMTLAVLVLSIFGSLAYVSQLFLKSLENSPHIYVFFKIGTEENDILDKKNEWEEVENINYVEYTSEEQARREFSRHNELNNNPLIAKEVEDESRSLPASLAIRLDNISEAQDIIDLVEREKSSNDDIYDVRYSRETINNIKEVVFWLRIGGGLIMLLLITVVFFFTLLTVEFRTYSRAKEIEIMQLVGGSLWYIRLPFILEGGIYGVLGAVISNILLMIVGTFVWYSSLTSNTKGFLVRLFGDLDWPSLGAYNTTAIGIFILTLLIGFIVGALNSLIAIRRYIK